MLTWFAFGQRVFRVQARIVVIEIEIAAPWPSARLRDDLNARPAGALRTENVRIDDDLLDLIARRNAAITESVDEKACRRSCRPSSCSQSLELRHERIFVFR